MLKCGQCGKRLRWRDILNPLKLKYIVQVIDKDENVIEKFRVCDSCAILYKYAEELIKKYGEKNATMIIKEVINELHKELLLQKGR